jgi:curved DNA-binding protein CbpA
MRMTVRQAYTTLGVTHGASEDEARTAYRRLALQFHPDKNPHAEATAKFQEISAAYKKICDFHKHGGNQRGSFFFDNENGDDNVAGFGGFDDDDEFGFGGMDFDDLEPTFEEMLMMFEMMFGPAMPSVGKSNKKKKSKKKKKATAPETATATATTTAAAAEAPTEAEPQPKVAVPLGKARRRKAPLGKQRGRNMFGGMNDFMDPEMMLFEQFMGMSMNDPELYVVSNLVRRCG